MRKSNQPSRNAKSHGNQKRPEFRNFHLSPLRRGEKKGPGISDVYAKVSLASLRPVAIPGLRHAVDITRVTRTQLLPLWSHCISSGFFCVKEGNSSAQNTTHLLPERCVPRLEHPLPFYRRCRIRLPAHFIRRGKLRAESFPGWAPLPLHGCNRHRRTHLPEQSTFAGENRKLPAGLPRMGRTCRWYRRLCIRFSWISLCAQGKGWEHYTATSGVSMSWDA